MSSTVIEIKPMPVQLPPDMLDRAAFIQQTKEIIEALATKKEGCMFSINGAWGSGKTYILNALEQELTVIQSEETAKEKYIIARYNCWQYDYYQEPLDAILYAIHDDLEKKTQIITDDNREKIKNFTKAIIDILAKASCEALKQKTGYDAIDILKTLNSRMSEDLKDTTPNESRYSPYLVTIKNIRKKIKEITEDTTLIVFVDELDRCLPTYAIQVLERMHHIFSELENVIVVLSIDERQLEEAIKQVYGEKTSVPDYLRKFISFSISLDTGKLNEELEKQYPLYFSQFVDGDCQYDYNVDEYLLNVFNHVEARTILRLVNKASIIHNLCFAEETPRHVLHAELLFTVLHDYYKDDSFRSIDTIRIVGNKPQVNAFKERKPTEDKKLIFNAYLNKIWQRHFENVVPLIELSVTHLIQCHGEWGSNYLLHYWTHMYEQSDFVTAQGDGLGGAEIISYTNRLKKFVNYLDTIH